jgi:hypothetical protein
MMKNKSKHIDNRKITLLIESYFEGLTTSTEEALLRHYFQQDQIADNLLIYKPLFVEWYDLREMSHRYSCFRRDPFVKSQTVGIFQNPNKVQNFVRIRLTYKTLTWKIISAAGGIAAVLFICFFSLFHESDAKTYVMIDGQKYSDKTLIMHNFEQSLDNVKIDMNDMLSELQTLDIEP